MSRDMTNSEAIANLNHIYGMVSPNIQRSLDVAFKALEKQPQGEWKLIHGSSVVFGCSRCNVRIIAMIPYNFCPNCGADMKVGAE